MTLGVLGYALNVASGYDGNVSNVVLQPNGHLT